MLVSITVLPFYSMQIAKREIYGNRLFDYFDATVNAILFDVVFMLIW
jgi:hypothetical protein